MRVTVHSYNGQYRLQFVVDRFEQAFKFPESDHTLAEVESMAGAMAEDVLMRFVDMRTQYHQSLTPWIQSRPRCFGPWWPCSAFGLRC